MMKVGIVGIGIVGRHLEQLFSEAHFQVHRYDKYQGALSADHNKADIQSCHVVFVAVPTNQKASGEIDLSEIEEAVSWIEPPICIKSTVTPGTVDYLTRSTGKKIIFSPEYIGETPYHRFAGARPADLVVLGGDRGTVNLFAAVYKQACGPEARYFYTDAVTAELAKYMENCFLAAKVAFVAQFAELADVLGADFDQAREIWVADPRVGNSHTLVIGKPGFRGKCLPKDLAAIVYLANKHGGAPLLEALQSYNNELRAKHG